MSELHADTDATSTTSTAAATARTASLLPPPDPAVGYIHALVYNKKHLLESYERRPAVLQLIRLRLVTAANVYIGDLSDGIYYVTARFKRHLNEQLEKLPAAPYVTVTCSMATARGKPVADVSAIEMTHEGTGYAHLADPVDVSTVDAYENTDQRHQDALKAHAEKIESAARAEKQRMQAEALKARGSSAAAAGPPGFQTARQLMASRVGAGAGAAEFIDHDADGAHADVSNMTFLRLDQLVPQMDYYTIRVKVEATMVREWSKNGRSGRILNVTVADADGYKMRCVSFEPDAWEPIFQRGTTCIITGGALVAGNVQYLADPRVLVELKLDKTARVMPLPIDSPAAISTTLGPFASAATIMTELKIGAPVTFVGYVAWSGDLTFLESKKSGKRFAKFETMLLDPAWNAVRASLLGEKAERLQDTLGLGDPVLCRGFKLDIYNGDVKITGGFEGEFVHGDALEQLAAGDARIRELLDVFGGDAEARIAHVMERAQQVRQESQAPQTGTSSKYDAQAVPSSVAELASLAAEYSAMYDQMASDDAVSDYGTVYRVQCELVRQHYMPSENPNMGFPWYDACPNCRRKLAGYVCFSCDTSCGIGDEVPSFCLTVDVAGTAPAMPSDGSAAAESVAPQLSVTLFDGPASRLFSVSAKNIADATRDFAADERALRIEAGLQAALNRPVALYLRRRRLADAIAQNSARSVYNGTPQFYECVDAYRIETNEDGVY